ncbi:hypothetical protein AAVH_14254 [Aphelenchoides avenae]|nr:hypothetical protein AAVH_14254 [Aphelenchus avenae]
MHSREIQVYIEVEDPNRLRVLIPGVVHARGAIDKLAIALRDSCRHRRVLFSSKVEPPQEIVEKSCAKLRAIIPPIGKALLGLLGDDVVETLVEYSEGRLMQMAERKLRHYIDSFLSKQQTNPENAPAFVYSSSQLSKGLLETLKTPDGADKAWEVLSRLMSDKHPEVPLKFLLHVKAAIVRSSRAHGLLKRLQHIADELLPPMFGGTLTEIARSFEWKSGDRFVMHRFDKTSKYVQHRLCVAYAKDLVYVHVEPKLSQKSMPYFDALTSAFLLCTELLAANSLKRFAIPYYAVWRERALQDFDGRAPDGAKFVLENALESYSPATAGYGEAPFRQFSMLHR